MDKIAIRLYRGPVGKAPGNNIVRPIAFITAIAIPAFLLMKTKAATIGISHIPKSKNGASGKGMAIREIDGLNTIVTAAITIINESLFVSISVLYPIQT